MRTEVNGGSHDRTSTPARQLQRRGPPAPAYPARGTPPSAQQGAPRGSIRRGRTGSVHVSSEGLVFWHASRGGGAEGEGCG